MVNKYKIQYQQKTETEQHMLIPIDLKKNQEVDALIAQSIWME